MFCYKKVLYFGYKVKIILTTVGKKVKNNSNNILSNVSNNDSNRNNLTISIITTDIQSTNITGSLPMLFCHSKYLLLFLEIEGGKNLQRT